MSNGDWEGIFGVSMHWLGLNVMRYGGQASFCHSKVFQVLARQVLSKRKGVEPLISARFTWHSLGKEYGGSHFSDKFRQK